MIKIALTKGRIEKNIEELLGELGYDTNPMVNKDRKLLIELGNELQIVFVKSIDVVNLVKLGFVDLGIVGSDIIFENPSEKYSQLIDFETGKCFFALCGYQTYSEIPDDRVKRIATKYPNIARAYFEKKKQEIEVIKLQGSVEIAPIIGISDAIVDIVETGDTLRANGLSVIEPIASVSTRLIGNNERIQEKEHEIASFVEKINNYKNRVACVSNSKNNR
ncbi:MAG: ATP phosphoribosyltransferase [Clostridia bacterium]|nr:ATP phosphoribosyltransferase [Clostridia bacterium]